MTGIFTAVRYAKILPVSTSTHRYHHGDLRAALLEQTVALVAECGIGGLSLREVSRRAGVSHAAAYNHFPNRAALVRAYVEAAFDEFARALRAASEAGAEPIDALRRIGVAYVRFAYEHPARFRIMFRPELSAIEERGGSPAVDAAYGVLVDGITTALAAGLIRGDATDLVRAAWAVVHGLATLILDGPGKLVAPTAETLDAMTASALGVLLDGMRVR